ncbi:sensor histidine kinase [Leifsonia poae]|uniref:sensor histidine kinase n=1 Tax=Leifsonia poae TaxID=110933 RepID=UPI003D6778DB
MDAVIAGVYLVPTIIIGIVWMFADPTWQNALRLGLSAFAGAALLLRRRFPVAVFAIALVAMLATLFLGHEVDFVAVLVALYAIAVYRSAPAAWIAFGVVSVSTAAALGLGVLLFGGAAAQLGGESPAAVIAGDRSTYEPFDSNPTASWITVVLISLFWVLIGINIGNRRRYLVALIDRAQQLARERDQQAVIAAAAERGRIAREMHDIVSHSLTVMITLADGSSRLAETSPERSADAMRMVAETGRSALGDMRRLLGVLRAAEGDGADREPQPGIGELGELVERFRAAGLPVRITVTGAAPTDTGQQLTVFRVVQEALTNALRYAALATAVDVKIAYETGAISITVEDDAAVHGASGQGTGRGLLGLRERVGLYGGTLEAGPRSGGGWRLRAVFDTIENHTDNRGDTQ